MFSTINAFGHEIFKTHCDIDSYYKNDDLKSAINSIFDLAEIKNRVRGDIFDSHVGDGETSEIVPYLGPANVAGGKQLTEWIKRACHEITGSNVTIMKSWMNRMDRGSQGRCHNHINEKGYEPTPDLIAIFYVNNPLTGSNLVFIKDGHNGALHSEFPEEDKIYVVPDTGDLVIHVPGIWHAVSEHNSDESRICFVYHLRLDNK